MRDGDEPGGRAPLGNATRGLAGTKREQVVWRRAGMRYQTQKVMIPAGDGTRMKLLILTPTEDYGKKNRTGILWIHGGGYVTGMAGMVHMSRAKELVKKYDAVVVSPGYRLAGQAPYPAALMDCHHALLYLKDHAEELGVRSDQIMVGGESGSVPNFV